MFTKTLNRETCNFLASKKNSLPVTRFILFHFCHSAVNLRSCYEAIVIKQTNGRANCIHFSIIVSSTYIALELNIGVL